MDEDRREISRSRTFLGGKVVINEAGSVIDCLVRNKSDDGCQIIVESQVGIPNNFELIIKDDEKYPCVVMWRKADKIGVKFV